MENAILSSLEIRADEDGAPLAFLDGEPAAVSISISHSRDRGICLAGPMGTALGCDLEWIEPREANFAADYFTPEEVALVLRAPFPRPVAETLIWSAKEAALKILKKGLTRDTRSMQIQVDFSGDETSWSDWTGNCGETSRTFRGLWRASDNFIYTLGFDLG